jgi:hypothetical protein
MVVGPWPIFGSFLFNWLSLTEFNWLDILAELLAVVIGSWTDIVLRNFCSKQFRPTFPLGELCSWAS